LSVISKNKKTEEKKEWIPAFAGMTKKKKKQKFVLIFCFAVFAVTDN